MCEMDRDIKEKALPESRKYFCGPGLTSAALPSLYGSQKTVTCDIVGRHDGR